METRGKIHFKKCLHIVVVVLIFVNEFCSSVALYKPKNQSATVSGERHRRHLHVEVAAKPDICTAKVNGRYILYAEKYDIHAKNRTSNGHFSIKEGLYTVVFDPGLRRKTGQIFSPGIVPNGAFFALQEFFDNIQYGHVIIFCTLGESSISLDRVAMTFFNRTRSSYMPDLQSKSPLVAVAVRGGGWLAEGYSVNLDALDPLHPGYAVKIIASVDTLNVEAEKNCDKNVKLSGALTERSRPGNGLKALLEKRRWSFCAKHDGYRQLCNCKQPQLLPFISQPFEDGSYFRLPIIILASNRPRYLHRCLSSLLANRGLLLSHVMVYVDGDHREVVQLLQLLGINYRQHMQESQLPTAQNVGTRIALNLRHAIYDAFDHFQDADKLVVLEEDLGVSPDFVSYFHQTHHLLDKDISLYCISAWSDHGYNHTTGDPAQLYRVSYMPGLGWMMKKSVLIDEIMPHWPPPWKVFDWDVLLRLPQHRRGRDCVVPDISRTYHFGFEGNHVNVGMQYKYFYDHALNRVADVQLKNVDKMTFAEYRRQIIALIREAEPIDGGNETNSNCQSLIPNNTQNKTYLLLIRMMNEEDTESWQKISTCLNLWDLDVRGDYAGLWQFWFNKNRVLVIGVPYSQLSATVVNSKGEIAVFSGKRSAREAKLGRWPPGHHRDLDVDKQSRLKMAAKALKMSYENNS